MSREHGVPCGCEVVRRTVTDFFMNPCRRTTADLPFPQGETQKGTDGAFVQFVVSVDRADNLMDVKYRATSCATLVAYAELAGERVVGQSAVEALRIDTATLTGWLPGVPDYKNDRARMVVQALWSAVARAVESQTVSIEGDSVR